MQTGESTTVGGRLELPGHQRGGIDVRLERGARLPQRVGGAVELADAVVAAADHGAHGAVILHDHGGGLRGAVFLAVLLQHGLDGVFGLALQVDVERGAHDEDALGHRLREGVDELLHLVIGPVEIVIRRALVAAVHGACGIAPRAEHLAFGHEAGLDQVVEHGIGAGARGRQVDVRGEFRRRLEQAGQHRGFREVHVARGFVEVILRGRVDAEGAAAHVGAVEIKLQDLVLGEPRLQPHGEEGFLHLALDGALVVEEQVLRELLGERGAALHHAAGLGVGQHGAEGAGDVDAEMLVEAPVFGREHRLDQVIGELLERNGVVVLDAARAHLVAVAVEDGHRELRLLQPVVVGGFLEGGERQRQHQDEAGGAERRAFRRSAPPGRAASRRRGSGP